MIGVNSISYQNVMASRLREQMLERSVATVDREEAANGAAQSDQFRQAAKDEKVPLSVYLQRAAQFRTQLKDTKKSEEDSKPDTDCPIAQARSESEVGENVPLNWLVADQFGGDGSAEMTGSGTESFSAEQPSAPSAELFSLTAPGQSYSEPSSLLSGEWLIFDA